MRNLHYEFADRLSGGVLPVLWNTNTSQDNLLNRQLQQKIEAARRTLDTSADSHLFAQFSPGAAPDDPELDGLPPALRDLLLVTNGFYAGFISVLSTKAASRDQFYCDDLDGGRDSWICFGGNMDFPFMIERATGAVWWFPDLDAEYPFDSRFERLTDGVDDFVDQYVFGPGYIDQIPSPPKDPWYDFLVAHGFLNEEG